MPEFELKVEVYSHRLCDDLSIASTPKKIKKKINEISSSVGRSVGRRLSGLVSENKYFLSVAICRWQNCIAVRAGSITLVSRYRDQFTSTPWQQFKAGILDVTIYNIVRKRKVLETNLKSEEILNFYPIFLYILTLL